MDRSALARLSGSGRDVADNNIDVDVDERDRGDGVRAAGHVHVEAEAGRADAGAPGGDVQQVVELGHRHIGEFEIAGCEEEALGVGLVVTDAVLVDVMASLGPAQVSLPVTSPA
ncbi:hypothetical protein ACFYXF_47645 [Streptomyces sp. NPDC002680]|uniref:hypothetical protein n=1 Tax=Streptomyces sp. NPDC002680 TaxID=3364659 RepID=UPI0036D10A6A